MSGGLGRSDQEVADIIDALDGLVDQVERHAESLRSELGAAEASGDARYVRRVTRGIEWAQALIDVLDEDVQERVMGLRHNAAQLGVAREGKMV